jgi:hypothetical protein
MTSMEHDSPQRRSPQPTERADQAHQDGDAFPLSPSQSGIWFDQQMAPENPRYNVASRARLRGPLNLEALQAAFEAVVERHPALRTHYSEHDGVPLQAVRIDERPTIAIVDAGTLSDSELLEELYATGAQPFDLRGGPMLRLHLFRKTNEECVLLMVAHHLGCDGWSAGIVWREMIQAYHARCRGQAIAFPPIQTSYADYVALQGERLEGPEGQRSWQYWKQQLAGDLPVLDFPFDRGRRAGT